jgi:hypothetical protein
LADERSWEAPAAMRAEVETRSVPSGSWRVAAAGMGELLRMRPLVAGSHAGDHEKSRVTSSRGMKSEFGTASKVMPSVAVTLAVSGRAPEKKRQQQSRRSRGDIVGKMVREGVSAKAKPDGYEGWGW